MSGSAARVVDVLVRLRTARFDTPLTYDASATPCTVGDVVRVPLGEREVYAFVLTAPREEPRPPANLRAIVSRVDGPRAFDELGLALAQWMSEEYLCSLGDALSAVVLAGAIPRVVERLVPRERPLAERFPSVPPRLVALLWGDFQGGITVEALLRHPEARRAGDRAAVLKAIGALVRGGALERRRALEGARITERTVRWLEPGAATIRGRRAEALVAFVAERGGVRRAEATLAGFSDAVIRRAIAAGALAEGERAVRMTRSGDVALPDLALTGEQRAAIAQITGALDGGTFAETLLFGITGSGKTLVYLHAIAHAVATGGRAIVLVPEIALTPQTAARFEAVFGDRVAVLHSALSDRERFDAWQAAARGEVAVVVGARSAVFAPLGDVRLIVVDEEHESTYRQDGVPRYDALAVARERMRRAGGVLVLGSATPSLVDYARAGAGRIALVELRERATAQPLPAVRIVDMSAELAGGNRRVFSTALIEALGERLARSEKSVLFINRRGAARFVLCRDCGHVPECPRCSTSLVLHRSDGLLRCHYCDVQRPIPAVCEQCGSEKVRAFGDGTQRIADDLAALFPDARVIRMDADTTTRIGDHARLLDAFGNAGDILVGTQMVAKGLDFPTVTLAAAIAADLDLHVADYRAAERTFALLTQICGRSGRARPGEAIVQTYDPRHPAIAFAAEHDYAGFAAVELADRKALKWPPYARLVVGTISGRSRQSVADDAEAYADALRGDDRWEVLGPAPHPLERRNDDWRRQLAVRTRDVVALRHALRTRVLTLARARRATRLALTIDA